MKTLKYRSSGPEVHVLEQLLEKLGYKVYVSNYFGKDSDKAVRDFQFKNGLVSDGIVGPKTWATLLKADQELLQHTTKFLSEQDLIDFANEYDLELASIKAVNEVESSGNGFFNNGQPKILFEGHVFWKELKKRGINPEMLLNANTKDVLYKSWTKKHYFGGVKEYIRLEKAASITSDPKVREAALSSASWGAFQIMGYHWEGLGYASIHDFVSEMKKNERAHLKAFGLFLKKNNLIRHIKNKNWKAFAKGYNGSLYWKNKYDERLLKAYKKYTN